MPLRPRPSLADPAKTSSLGTQVQPRLVSSDSEQNEVLFKQGDMASSDSGSLTQRAALIRDELLGNDSLEQTPTHGSLSSSGIGDDETAYTSLQEDVEDRDDLEERLRTSSIAQSLRHIGMAYDEKSRELESLRNVSTHRRCRPNLITRASNPFALHFYTGRDRFIQIQQKYVKEITLLRAEAESKQQETESLKAQLAELTKRHKGLQAEVEALKGEVEHKDELLCFSDRISSRLFDKIHAIRAQVEEAESLSPAIRSRSVSSCASASDSSSPATNLSDESNSTHTLTNVATPFEALIKKIEAKYAD